LNERFEAIGLHLRRTDPLPSFLKVRAELQIEELTMSKTAQAAALLSSSSGGTGPADGVRPPAVPPSNFGGHSGHGGGGGRSAPNTGGAGSTGGYGPSAAPPWPTYQNPWTGSIHMWPGARGPAPPPPPAPGLAQPPHAFVAGPPGQWAGSWGAPSVGPPLPPPRWTASPLVGTSRR
jgi:hypothetical protein